MLSIGIKNSILVILIILIIHVFLKNLILNKTENFTQNVNPTITDETSASTIAREKLNPFQDQTIAPIPKYYDAEGVDRYGKPQSKEDMCRDITVKNSQMKDYENLKMLEYINNINNNKNDNNNYKDNLDKYFKDNVVSDEVEKLEKKFEKCDARSDICKFKADNHQLPTSTTCDPGIFEIKPSQSLEKRVMADCNLPQDKKNIMILNKYENENTMNGGLLYGELNAYDEFDTNYENYSCKI